MLPTYQAATGSISRAVSGAASRSGAPSTGNADGMRSMSGTVVPSAREAGIEPHEIGEPHADAAEAHGEAGRLAFGQHQRGAGLAQPRA